MWRKDTPLKIRLAKIDVEEHDISVLKGKEDILRKDRPVLIIEEGSSKIEPYLEGFGYSSERIGTSHNKVFS